MIEYNGQQHYFPVRFNNSTTEIQAENNFKIQQIHDNSKIEYSIQNKIPLLIIPYWELNNIEKLLIKFLDDINYFKTNNNCCASFDFEENRKYLKDLNSFKIDELKDIYKDNKTKIGKLIKYNGEIHNIKDWAEKLNIKKGTLWYRINQEKSLEDAFNKDINQYNKNIINYNGNKYTQRELSNYLQIPETYLSANLTKGMDVDSILKKYKNRKKYQKPYQIEYNGKIYTKKELSKMLNIPWTSLSRYIERGENIYEIAKKYSNITP